MAICKNEHMYDERDEASILNIYPNYYIFSVYHHSHEKRLDIVDHYH